MAAKGGRIDFMFLSPPLSGRWIRYWIRNQIIGHVENKNYTTIIDSFLPRQAHLKGIQNLNGIVHK